MGPNKMESCDSSDDVKIIAGHKARTEYAVSTACVYHRYLRIQSFPMFRLRHHVATI